MTVDPIKIALIVCKIKYESAFDNNFIGEIFPVCFEQNIVAQFVLIGKFTENLSFY